MINKHWNECTNEDKATMKNEVMIANNDDFFDCNYAAAFITSTPNSFIHQYSSIPINTLSIKSITYSIPTNIHQYPSIPINISIVSKEYQIIVLVSK